jgi:hypothetical protein
VRSGPGAARTILLFHTISARPSKQARMVESTLGVYSFALILFLQEQIKDIIIIHSYFFRLCMRRARHSLLSHRYQDAEKVSSSSSFLNQ